MGKKLHHSKNAGALGMFPLIISRIYTLHKGNLLGISYPFLHGPLGLKQLEYHPPEATSIFFMILVPFTATLFQP